MKSALIAMDPLALSGKSFEKFCQMIRLFQEKRFFSRTSVLSVMHSSQFLLPYEYYNKNKTELSRETRTHLKAACSGKFQFANARVVVSESHHNEEIVKILARQGKRQSADLLVVGSQDRKGLPYWFLGSLSETASLTAKLPILVLKPATFPCSFSKKLKFVLAVDVAAPPSRFEIIWLSRLAKAAQAQIELVYVEPRRRAVIDQLQLRKSRKEAVETLERLKRSFEARGVAARALVEKEGLTVSHTIVEFASRNLAILTIATTVKRSKARQLLLGSTSRQILALTKRPFLSLRLS